MSKPTTARTPQEQYKKEQKRFLTRMKPKPVLVEKIKKKKEREESKRNKFFSEDMD